MYLWVSLELGNYAEVIQEADLLVGQSQLMLKVRLRSQCCRQAVSGDMVHQGCRVFHIGDPDVIAPNVTI